MKSAEDDDGGSVVSDLSGSSVAKYSTGREAVSREPPQIKAIYALLAHDRFISTRDHTKAAEHLCALQAALCARNPVSRASQIKLICVITSLLRRITRLRAEAEASLQSGYVEGGVDTADVFVDTLTLAFVLVAVADVSARGGVPVDSNSAEAELKQTMGRTLWSELSRVSNKRRAEPGDGVDELERQRLITEEIVDRRFIVSEDSSSWSTFLFQPGACAGAALRVAGGLVESASLDMMLLFRDLAFVFARNTIAQMQTQMLKSCDDRDFLTLSTQHVVYASSDECNEDLMTIILAGESEAGQSCLRDIIVSFLLPKDVIGVRRTLLLSREISARVASEYPWVAGIAHETAMIGCENVWKTSKSELKRACALLAGFAMLSTSGCGDDMIRKSTAFDGRVQLPFLECAPPAAAASSVGAPCKMLALVPSTRSWVIYSISHDGKPLVDLSNRGLDGLCMALLSFVKLIAPRRHGV